MLRILSWNSGLGCDQAHSLDYNVVPEHSSSLISSLSLSTPMKRKRSPSIDAPSTMLLSRSLPSNAVDQDSLQTMQANATSTPQPMSDIATPDNQTMSTPVEATECSASPARPTAMSSETRLNKMRQTISSQLSLEILIKHKELRLIEQEMATCQVALEQLRRCTEIPFPSMQSPVQSVSQGCGPAVRQLGQRYPPVSPAPWGVTDGPYSRHYAKWLLPDRRFDGGEPEPESVPTSAISSSGRSTRGYYVDVLAGKTVKSRARHTSNLQALPAGYAQPKEKATGPMILKRKSDGQMVKLVCPDCGRHDFGSAQGFINHCRIGHSRSFASHDAAAEACGETIEYNENGSIKGLEPAVIGSSSLNTSVHPLVRSAKLLSPSSPVSPCVKDYIPGLGKVAPVPSKPVPLNFQASQQTPHLSALIQTQGLGLDLQHLVTDAQIKVEEADSDVSEDEMDIESPILATGGRHPQVAGSKQPTKSSMTHVSSTLLNHSNCAELDTTDRHTVSTSQIVEATSRNSMSGVLPSPTNESTQAPSLVDDDEEFDPQSPMSSHDIDEVDLDFEVHDDERCDRGSRFQDLTTQQATCSPNPESTTAVSPAARRNIADPDKHVTFVQSNPPSEGGDKKRRKIQG